MTYTPARENVLADLKTSCENIDGSSNYYLDVSAAVSRNEADIHNPPAPDWLVIVPGSMNPEAKPSELYADEWRVSIVGGIECAADPDHDGRIDRRREKLISDVTIATFTDPRRGGYARSTRLVDILLADISNTIGWFELGLAIRLDHTDITP